MSKNSLSSLFNKKILLGFSFLLWLALPPFSISGKKIKQVHKIETASKGKGGKEKEKIKGNKVNSDSDSSAVRRVRIYTDSLTAPILKFSGYDKPAKSSKESFHIINNSDTTISKVGIRITYLDLQNRMLHSRDTQAECMVPPKETRLTSIPSWDIQHTFYYYLGPEPKMTATPYKVKIELLWFEY